MFVKMSRVHACTPVTAMDPAFPIGGRHARKGDTSPQFGYVLQKNMVVLSSPPWIRQCEEFLHLPTLEIYELSVQIVQAGCQFSEKYEHCITASRAYIIYIVY